MSTSLSEYDPPCEAANQSESEDQHCPECSGSIVTLNTEIVCEDCGLVVEESNINHGPDWGLGGQGEDLRRASPIDLARHDMGIGTDGFSPGDTEDRDAKRRETIANRMSADDSEKETLRDVFGEINRLGNSLAIPNSVVDTACMLFRQLYTEEDVDCRGHNLDHVAATVVYIASREANIGLVNATVVDQVEMCDDINSEFTQNDLLNETQWVANILDMQLTPRSPDVFIPRIVTQLDGSARVETLARKIAQNVRESDLRFGGNPAGIAGGIVYEAFRLSPDDEKVSQTDVGEAIAVSKRTVRKHWRTIKDEELAPVTSKNDSEAQATDCVMI